MTIKTQGGKVITKGGKVSCSCCEEPTECCMYPADRLNIDYGFDDLPDEFFQFDAEVKFLKLPAPIVFPESVQYYFDEDEERGGFFWKPVSNAEFFRSPGRWGYDASEFDPSAICFFNVDGITVDLFSNTYTVDGPISGTVTRNLAVSQCIWQGSGLTLSNFGFQWRINGNNKSGFQNTPVGSYAGGFTVS